MPPALAVASIDALQAAIASWRPTLVGSIHSPSRPMTLTGAGPWLPIVCHDREAMAAMVSQVSMPRAVMGHTSPISLPMPSHVSALSDAMKAHGIAHGDAMGSYGAKLFIDCHAGLRRSPAMAIVALMMAGLQARAAVDAVAQAVPKTGPNRLILRHAEALFGEAIVIHVQYAWPYRRGPAGA